MPSGRVMLLSDLDVAGRPKRYSSFGEAGLVTASTTWTANSSTLSPGDSYLSAVYHFNSGALTTDSIGSNTLTNNNAIVESASGIYGYCADLELSSSQYFSIASTSTDFDSTNYFTVSFWVKLESLPSSEQVFWAFTCNSYHHSLAIYDNAGTYTYEVQVEDTSGDRYSGSVAVSGGLSTGVWYNFVYVANGTVVKIYKNGVDESVDLAYTAPLEGTNSLNIGASHVPNYYVDGLIDEWYYWKDYALSSTQVTALYNSGTGAFYTG